MTEHHVLAEGLKFPEGPIAMPDGSVVLVEIARGTLSRVTDGDIRVIADLGGGPNGAAIGPDGRCYVCNNGGFAWVERGNRIYPGEQDDDYSGGRIEAVNLETGDAEVLYTHCDGLPLRGPNDIVFDRTGGFWFTDHGKTRSRERDRTGVFYAMPDGSSIREVIFPMEGPNGIGLSPDEDEVYVAETPTGRMWAFELAAPGRLQGERRDRPDGGRLLPGRLGYCLYDSLAVDAEGNVCVATIIDGGITIVSPGGAPAKHVPLPDRLTTNICFGGKDLQTAFVTLSSTGKLVSMPWKTPGLPLNFLNRT
ncbi:MAG: SMP-30/gluconolactonase/LRE family protein [Gammaproteobacteria bacterium]|nr:SMP-30/gluconolactonase/LRE family protein [Gammaproteobacteria bacterium]